MTIREYEPDPDLIREAIDQRIAAARDRSLQGSWNAPGEYLDGAHEDAASDAQAVLVAQIVCDAETDIQGILRALEDDLRREGATLASVTVRPSSVAVAGAVSVAITTG